MTMPKLPELNRPAYSLQEIAELAGISMDKLLGEHVGRGDIDLYFDVPDNYKVYLFVTDRLEELFGEAMPHHVHYDKGLISVKEQDGIVALRLSQRDCEGLVRSRKVTQSMFWAGLERKEAGLLETVFSRDRNFIPAGNMKERLYKFPDLRTYTYRYFFGFYPNKKISHVDEKKEISYPLPQTILATDVWAIRKDVCAFLEKFEYPVVSLKPINEKPDIIVEVVPSDKLPVGIPAELLPFFEHYSCLDKITTDGGVV